jgi:hypothetical protein
MKTRLSVLGARLTMYLAAIASMDPMRQIPYCIDIFMSKDS